MLATGWILLLLCGSAQADSRYIFSIKVMEEIARSAAGQAGPAGEFRKEMLDEVNRKLHAAYPELIMAPGEGEWIFNSVGGSLAEIKVLFCSPNEYVALWGAPVETDGFSGRYNKMDVWDIMLDGSMQSYAPGGNHQYDVYENTGFPGTHLTSWLRRGIGKHFRLEKGAYMIDYGRGNLISSLASGAILGHTNVTGDSYSLRKMLGGCAQATFRNWFNAERRRAVARYRETNPDYETDSSSR